MQVGQWLGFVTDTIGMQFGVPPVKISQLKSDLDFIISSRFNNQPVSGMFTPFESQ